MLLYFPDWHAYPDTIRATTYEEARRETLTQSQMQRIVQRRGWELQAEMEAIFLANGNEPHRCGLERIIRTFKLLGEDLPFPDNFDELVQVMMHIYAEGVWRVKPQGEICTPSEMQDVVVKRRMRISDLLEELELGLHDDDAELGGTPQRIAMNASSLRAKLAYFDSVLNDIHPLPRTNQELNLACLCVRLNESASFRQIFSLSQDSLRPIEASPLLLDIISNR